MLASLHENELIVYPGLEVFQMLHDILMEILSIFIFDVLGLLLPKKWPLLLETVKVFSCRVGSRLNDVNRDVPWRQLVPKTIIG